MKAIYSHGCGQIATVSLAWGSRLVNRPPGHHGTKASSASLPVSSLSSLSSAPVYITGVIVIIHGTKASFRQKGRSRECRRPPVNMAQRPISSKRLVTRASPTGHYRIWHEDQCWQKVGRGGIPDHHILWHKRPIRAKVGRAIADHWQTWHKGQ